MLVDVLLDVEMVRISKLRRSLGLAETHVVTQQTITLKFELDGKTNPRRRKKLNLIGNQSKFNNPIIDVNLP